MRPGLYLAASILLASMVAGCKGAAADPLSGTGTLEMVEVDVAALTPARVIRVWHREGDVVHAGDTLVTLTTSTVHADIDGRRAKLASAEAQFRDLQAGARPAEVAGAEAQFRSAEAEAARARRDAERLTPLAASGAISRQQFDAVRSTALSAEARRDAQRDALVLVREGARPERVRGAAAEVANARASLASAEQAAADLVLTAPTEGTVVSRNAEPGEVLSAGTPTMTLADTRRPYVRIYLGPASIPLVHVGAPAAATLDAFPGRSFTGRVAMVSTRAEYTPRVALTEEERADQLFAVRIEFEDRSGMLKAGLPVTVHITKGTELAKEAPDTKK